MGLATGVGTRAFLGLIALSGTACIIVNDPPPARPVPPPHHAATPAAAKPVAATPAVVTTATPAPVSTGLSANAGPQGPHTNVAGKDYVTLRSANAFGDGNNTPTAWHGLVYFLGAGATSVPSFDTLTPVGALFTQTFSASATPYQQGFPGIDQTRNENFGIRFEGSFTTAAVGDYLFRLTSDDGAKLSIDNVPLVSNDGVHNSRDATGHLQLSAGTHNFRLDYFQVGGGVALQVHVTGPTGSEKAFAPAI